MDLPAEHEHIIHALRSVLLSALAVLDALLEGADCETRDQIMGYRRDVIACLRSTESVLGVPQTLPRRRR